MRTGIDLAKHVVRLGIPVWILMAVPESGAVLLSGTVTNPDGIAVENVDLDLDDLSTGERIFTPNDNTDPDGTYEIDVPAGLYRISFEPLPGTGLAPTVIPRVDVRADRVLDVRLERGVSLAGRVTSPDGLGVADVDLNVVDPATGIKIPTPGDNTNALGFYAVTVPTGLYDLVFSAPVATRLVSVRLEGVEIPDHRTVNVPLVEGVALSGTVRASGGAPAASVDLDVVDLATGRKVPLTGDRTDATGTFLVIVPPGEYELTLEAPVESRLVARVDPRVEIPGDVAVEYALEPGFLLNGSVAGPGGIPVERADMDFLRLPDLVELPTPSDFTNSVGLYAVVLPGGAYDVVANPPPASPWDPDTTHSVELRADTRLDVLFGGADLPGGGPDPDATITLSAPYPNPSRGSAAVTLGGGASGGRGRLLVYDGLGRLVRILHDGSVPPEIEVTWDGRDRSGLPVASGIYFLTLDREGSRTTRKLSLVR